jgi:hypothetical protein
LRIDILEVSMVHVEFLEGSVCRFVRFGVEIASNTFILYVLEHMLVGVRFRKVPVIFSVGKFLLICLYCKKETSENEYPSIDIEINQGKTIPGGLCST